MLGINSDGLQSDDFKATIFKVTFFKAALYTAPYTYGEGQCKQRLNYGVEREYGKQQQQQFDFKYVVCMSKYATVIISGLWLNGND